MTQMQIAALVLVSSFIAVPIGVFVMHRRWLRAAPEFPVDHQQGNRFDEKWTSGWSERTRWTKYKGSKRSLWVTVTATELWIRPHLMFRFVDRDLDLTMRVDLSSIQRVETMKRRVRVHFSGDLEKSGPVVLELRNQSAFIKALENKAH